MSAQVYFMRHGESESNRRNVFAGRHVNTQLTPSGISYAHEISRDLKEKGLEFGRIYASSLDRSIDTAEIINTRLIAKPSEVISIPEFDEFDFGEFTNQDRNVPHDVFINSDIEDFSDFKKRVTGGLHKLTIQNTQAILVTHAMVLSMIQYILDEEKNRTIPLEKFYLINPFDHRPDLFSYNISSIRQSLGITCSTK